MSSIFFLTLTSGLIAHFSGIHHIYITTGRLAGTEGVVVIPGFIFYIVDKVNVKKRGGVLY